MAHRFVGEFEKGTVHGISLYSAPTKKNKGEGSFSSLRGCMMNVGTSVAAHATTTKKNWKGVKLIVCFENMILE